MLSEIEARSNTGPAGKESVLRKIEFITAMKEYPLKLSLFLSITAHAVLLPLAANVIRHTNLRQQDLVTVSLFEVQLPETAIGPRIEVPRQIKNPPTAPPTLARAKEEAARPIEAMSSAAAKSEIAPSVAPAGRVEGGGSEAGAEHLFGTGDVGVVPGPGTGGGGGGTAASGLRQGSGAPGLPAQTTPLRTNREAKPVQTVKAAYPPMALRMGMESDVTLKIAVDREGRVTQAEITKSGGPGFDDEALKAVKQSRFEPAQRDGRNVPAEFIYIYRFRLQR